MGKKLSNWFKLMGFKEFDNIDWDRYPEYTKSDDIYPLIKYTDRQVAIIDNKGIHVKSI